MLLFTGGYVVIVMGNRYTVEDEDLMQVKPIIQSMVAEKKIELLEEYTFDGYFTTYDGLVMVLKKL